jgi:phospholipid/cholesterol/gamma-HCH transport system ATP-binding protein
MSAAVVVRDLSIDRGDVSLVEHVSFEVAPGEIFGVLGGSGSGKSTLLRYLVGLDRPTHGTVDVAGGGAPDLARGLPPFGVMFQKGALFGSMTVLENTALPLREWTSLGADAIDVIARSKLRLVGLEDAADKLPAELSGGMTKRAAIARALALDPTLVFLDEPQSGLDPVTVAELDELIVTLARSASLTVVLVTHEIESILRIVDRCLLLDRPSRGVAAVGDPRELRASDDPRVHRFFNARPSGKERQWRPRPTS